MSTQQLDRLQGAASPARIGQATAVEQSRAVAEVHAMVVVAQQMPRDIDRADREMRRSCSRKSMAEKAFYRFPRGGQQVSGESIVLAKELARCWGNIDYGIAELRRDDFAGESEMMAFAWDLETNTRPRTTFIVPHVRDNGSRLTAPRDIYENNANMGVRRMREMILNLMPPWFVEDAKDLCYATLKDDTADGATVAERASKAVERFAKIGVTAAQLVQKLGAPQARWSPSDLAQLAVIFKSVDRGETTAEAEFGPSAARISTDDLAPQKPSPAGKENPRSEPSAPPSSADVPPAGEATRKPQLATSGQRGFVTRQFERLGIGADDRLATRLAVLSHLTRREVKREDELTGDEARKVKDTLEGFGDDGTDLDGLLAEIALADDPRGDGEPGE